jgi:hypothetical protein
MIDLLIFLLFRCYLSARTNAAPPTFVVGDVSGRRTPEPQA